MFYEVALIELTALQGNPGKYPARCCCCCTPVSCEAFFSKKKKKLHSQTDMNLLFELGG